MKPILITGATGFLGKYLLKELQGTAEVLTLGRSSDNSVVCDLKNSIPKIPSVGLVVHNAGKAHSVPKSKAEADEFFQVNTIGTRNLLEGLDNSNCLPDQLIFISTVAVYGKDHGVGIDEQNKSLGNSPYAISKIEAEKLVIDWSVKNQVPAIILRLPLVIGLRNPKGNLKSMIEGIKKGFYFRPGKGNSKKSMVHAIDVAKLLPRISQKNGVFNLTDGYDPTFSELDTALGDRLSRKIKVIPESILMLIARVGDVFSFLPINSDKLKKMTRDLTFSDQKARLELSWNPEKVLDRIKKESLS